MNESIDTGLLELYGEAMTIHRMLGARHDGSFSKGVKNRLNSDTIIIDEASMIDIDLFIHIIRACKEGSQLILVGDRFQLDSGKRVIFWAIYAPINQWPTIQVMGYLSFENQLPPEI